MRLMRGTPACITAYIFFTLFPHFDSVTHSHGGEEKSHTHGFPSSHAAALERVAWAALQSRPLEAEAAVKNDDPAILSVEPGTGGIKPDAALHTHFQQDPNVLAQAGKTGLPGISIAPPLPAPCRPLVPSRPDLDPSARGPPPPSLSAIT